VQSGFTAAVGECNAITSQGLGPSELTFVLNAKTAFRRFPQARFWIAFSLTVAFGHADSSCGRFTPSCLPP
jgi:hypothetical protein